MFTLSIRRRRIAAGVSALAFAAFAAADDKPTTVPAEPDLLTNVARQAALDRAGFSPGVIDGKVGPKTLFAVREFQTARKLPATGEFDEETLKALRVASVPALDTYTITAEDIADIGEFPSDWNAKARLERLRYESLEALLGERGHCKKALLETLNPELKLGNLRAGDKLKLPFIEPDPLTEKAASLEVDLDHKTVRARDKVDRTLLVFHCSVAADAAKFPSGNARVVVVKFDPEYSFKPEMWPEVHNVHDMLLIPPGPRNPVGLCWIGVSLPGYGIHGTPQPELIGKTGSHGCIRLANWDAVRLGKIVAVETPVQFVNR